MAIENMAEFFGCDASDVFEAKEQAEGYLAGCTMATQMQELVRQNGIESHRGRAYVEGVLMALREQL